jgi:hypothetical protein
MTHIGEKRNAHVVLVRNPEGKGLEDARIDGTIILK